MVQCPQCSCVLPGVQRQGSARTVSIREHLQDMLLTLRDDVGDTVDDVRTTDVRVHICCSETSTHHTMTRPGTVQVMYICTDKSVPSIAVTVRVRNVAVWEGLVTCASRRTPLYIAFPRSPFPRMGLPFV